MSLTRWGLAPLLAGLAVAGLSSAEELSHRASAPSQATLRVAESSLELEKYKAQEEGSLGRRWSAKDALYQADLQRIEDFHPETDRWTDRTNRIRITLWQGGWFFSSELDIHHDYVVGFRINWEVPVFIGIRWDSGFVPWSRMEVKAVPGINTNPASSRWMSGVVHSHTLNLGAFSLLF